jgi:hypothetical protein
MAQEGSKPIEQWTAKRLVTLVVSILKGELSVAEAAGCMGSLVGEVEEWREKFLRGPRTRFGVAQRMTRRSKMSRLRS